MLAKPVCTVPLPEKTNQARHRKAVPRAVEPEGQVSLPWKVLRFQEAANDLGLQGFFL
jgi:hypothetical protein